jgi:2'-5' RNA ligase
VRLFVAFETPPGLLPVPEGFGLRPIAEAHMTLVFLGEQEAAEPVCSAVGGAVAAAGPLVAERWAVLPRRRPRVLAAVFSDPTSACNALQAAIVRALADAGLCEPESRPWLPHVSVARLGRDVAPPRVAALPAVEPVSWTPESVSVVRSHLGGPRPARYETLRSWPLAQGPPPGGR